MEWRFNGRHGLFLDLAGIVSSFFFIHFHIQPSFQNFLYFIFSIPQHLGELIYNVSKQRGGISVGRLECTGWNGT